MALLPIVIAPDPVLKKKANPVPEVNDDVRQLMDDMLATMYHAQGIGLAATQVGDLRRVLVVDVAIREEGKEETTAKEPIFMANPEITWSSETLNVYQEGCLSIPDQYADVERPAEVKVRYLDRDGQEQEIHADGILATCVQHEIDHLNGVLFVDHISSLKRGMLLKKSAKIKKARNESQKQAAD